jgi:hypothetical protein
LEVNVVSEESFYDDLEEEEIEQTRDDDTEEVEVKESKTPERVGRSLIQDIDEPATVAGDFTRSHFGVRTRISLYILVITVSVVLGVVFLFKGINNVVTHTFLSNETSSLDYQVCYIENEFFDEECLPKDRQYVAGLINFIETEFNYSFNASDLFDYQYTYSITANIIAHERGQPNRVLFEREEVLLPASTVQMRESVGFNLNEEIIIDYRRYNEIINDFRREYALSFDSMVIVTLHVRVEGEHQNINEKIIADNHITMEIPLSEQTLDIQMIYQDLNSNNVVNSESKNVVLDVVYYSVAALYSIFALIVLIKFIRFTSKISVSKTPYQKRLAKIMREYELIIVETKVIPEISTEKLYEIASFEELLDVQAVLQRPIMYVKIHSEKSCFAIIDNNDVYRYVMKAVDIETEKEKKQ